MKKAAKCDVDYLVISSPGTLSSTECTVGRASNPNEAVKMTDQFSGRMMIVPAATMKHCLLTNDACGRAAGYYCGMGK